MPKWINKSSLPVNTPWSFMIFYFIKAAIRTCLYCPCNKCIGIFAKYFNPC